jgi:hypothetical protein
VKLANKIGDRDDRWLYPVRTGSPVTTTATTLVSEEFAPLRQHEKSIVACGVAYAVKL